MGEKRYSTGMEELMVERVISNQHQHHCEKTALTYLHLPMLTRGTTQEREVERGYLKVFRSLWLLANTMKFMQVPVQHLGKTVPYQQVLYLVWKSSRKGGQNGNKH